MAKKENALDLAKLIDKGVRVKLSGGREGEMLAPRYMHPQCMLTIQTLCFIGILLQFDLVVMLISRHGLQWRAFSKAMTSCSTLCLMRQ